VGEQEAVAWATTNVMPGGPGSRRVTTRRGGESNKLREMGVRSSINDDRACSDVAL